MFSKTFVWRDCSLDSDLVCHCERNGVERGNLMERIPQIASFLAMTYGDNLKMPYYIYILECSDKTLYVGSTNNLEKRLYKHNNAKSGAHYTKIRRPVVLKYSEKLKNLSEALKREVEIKGWKRKEKLDLIQSVKMSAE